MKWTPWKYQLVVLHGAHEIQELNQEQEPWSLNSTDRTHRVAHAANVGSVARGCWTSIVKIKGCRKLGH